MFKIKRTILLVSLLLTGFSSWAMSPKEIIYKAYISADMQLWRTVIDNLHAKANKTLEQELELLNYARHTLGIPLSVLWLRNRTQQGQSAVPWPQEH